MLLDLLGKLWALPITLGGLTYGLLGSLLGGASISLQHNAICFENFKPMAKDTGLTLGNIILCNTSLVRQIPTYSELDGSQVGYVTLAIGDHEECHTYQYQKYGIFFPLVWLFSGGASSDDYLEQQADQYALKIENK